MKRRYPLEWNKNTILKILEDLDQYFSKQDESVEALVIGGVAIVLQNFQSRSTNDLDLAPVSGADRLLKACEKLNIPAQFVSLTSTVDFNAVEKIVLYEGKSLTLYSVSPTDLIRLKLERFRKHDPEDIYAIIKKKQMVFENFETLACEGATNFVGRTNEYILSAQIVVERMYPNHLDDFKSHVIAWRLTHAHS